MAALETERLVLEGWSERWLEEYVRLLCDEGTMAFLGGTRTREQAEERFRRYVDHWRERGFGPRFAVERATGRWVGVLALRVIDDEPHGAELGDVELGWILAPEAYGRGFATEGAVAMRDWGFRDVGLGFVVARMEASHTASANVAERIGMRFDAELETPWGRMRRYRLERDEWERMVQRMA